MVCKICGKEIPKDKAPYHEPLCSVECFEKDFWLDILKRKNRELIIDGKAYLVGKTNSLFKGFSGRRFYIRMLDTPENKTHLYGPNEVFTTDNLWHNGTVPENFKEQLPNNAEFITENEYNNIMGVPW